MTDGELWRDWWMCALLAAFLAAALIIVGLGE